MAAHCYQDAQRVIDAGLVLAPGDSALIESRGDVRAGSGDVKGALTDWRRSHEVNPESLSPLYRSAFVLERVGRVDEAVDAWRQIITWAEDCGNAAEADWPKQELAQLLLAVSGHDPTRTAGN